MAVWLGISMRGRATGDPSSAGAIDALLSRAGTAVVFSEFGVEADSIWAANPSDPNDRVLAGTAPHASGFSVFPALSPDGAYVAYTALGAGSSDTPGGGGAQLVLLDIASGESRVLANDVDLRSTPVWSANADAVAVRRAGGGEGSASSELLRVALDGSASTIAAQPAALYAIDFTPDGGALYYATLTAGGTDLMRAPASAGASGAPQTVAHLSDGIARNWHLSPDGTQLAYLAQAPADAATAYVMQLLDIESGAVATPLGSNAGAQFNPVWDSNGSVTVGRVSDGERAAIRIGTSAGGSVASEPLAAPPTGFDVPLSWSPDGALLIVRTFESASTAQPGPSHVIAIDATGARHQLSPLADVEIAGWLVAEPAP